MQRAVTHIASKSTGSEVPAVVVYNGNLELAGTG